MIAENCRKALSSEDNRVLAVNACIDRTCGCETCSVSPHSPGKVDDEEVLHFLVPAPDARSENGYLAPPFLMQIHVNGLSVLRGDATDEEFELTIAELRPRWEEKSRYLEGIISIPVARIRYDGDARFCCVYDTGYERRPHHADIMAPKEDLSVSNSELKRRRYRFIREVVQRIGDDFTSVEDFRSGAFSSVRFSI